ncbi:MAG: sigma factor [Odoribacter splanchnicus]
MEKTYAYEVEKIFTSWYSSLCYFAFRYVQDDETARDIVQEVFVRLMEKRQSVQSE